MKKVIYNKFDKHLIETLPRVSFPGRIITIFTKDDVSTAVDYLLNCDILGVDTETKPVFKAGLSYKVSLLQVSTHDTCFLIRLNKTGMTPDIIRFLEDTKVPKVGLSWHDDILGLERREKFKPGYFIDLQNIAPKLGIEDKSLQKLYANIFHMKISKSQRLTNWAADQLRENQKMYAATDAWTCIKLYEEMQRLLKTHDYQLVKVPEPVAPVQAVQDSSEADKTSLSKERIKGV
ncbi:MAG: 3'-5' exonuclease domain-containing protein 2 [Prevotella sp.]|jgi:ribonuclease D|uniref:3'-5' exonuclease n=1 Tax=Segatella cerevisiae TaxID=2053716 RepID=A0ABT1BW10_9BACT|nr:3'-5' exonuclease [Segatella cerevisiae]MCH3993682.1 3'-5' exonuclease domain-containing protein 2 [Prevotella sp.]MCI1245933.1 3'-5' exonuclease domain-containing protein 2 [Prevotella sp.]MCO6024617.1 3'-5' exonuclease domain-containing protein 2 [Segatella cerevisiae]